MKDKELLLLGAGVFLLARERKRRANAKAAEKKEPVYIAPTPAKPVEYAWLYRRPNETEIRMSVGPTPDTAQERGIFGTPEAAKAVARESGFTLAWPEPRDLP